MILVLSVLKHIIATIYSRILNINCDICNKFFSDGVIFLSSKVISINSIALNNFMTQIKYKKEIGSGIYTIPDISRLLGFPKAKVGRYLNQYWDERLGKKLFSDTYSWSADGKNKAVNFYVLIELYSFFKLQEMGVTTHKILKSRENIAKELKVEYPFASAGLLTDGTRIWYEFKDSIINSDGTRQINLGEILKEFANKIEFDNNRLAERFFPAGKSSSIIVDPHHQFGQPIIKGTNVNIEAIFSMYKSGEPIQSIGILYDLSVAEVNQAIDFLKNAA
jgi:uncharacterized protein (DUF433 family)